MRPLAGFVLCLLTVSHSPIVAGHHSFVGFYDQSEIIEIEGVLRTTDWRNPHGRLTVDVTEPDGSVTQWQIETGSVSVLRTRGLNRQFVKPGDRIRIAGEAALRADNGLYARNMLLPGGQEVMLSIGITPRWTNAETGELLEAQYDEQTGNNARRAANGLFRVWSTVLDDPASFPLFKGAYPLNDAGMTAQSQWDASDVVQLGCVAKGMPGLMITPYPIEFVDDGERVLIHFEEDNATRTIDMRQRTPAGDVQAASLGRSLGEFVGADTLIVTTDAISSGILDDVGTPLSAQATLVETFRLANDEQRLDYTLHVTDPVNYTEPFALQRYFIWRPELTVQPYDCIVVQ